MNKIAPITIRICGAFRSKMVMLCGLTEPYNAFMFAEISSELVIFSMIVSVPPITNDEIIIMIQSVKIYAA